MTTAPYVVTRASLPQDRSELLRLWTGSLALDAPESRYEWLYGDGHRTASWMLRTHDGAPVGAASLTARTFRSGGQELRGAQGIDFVVEKQHRTLGPAFQLQRSVTGSLVSERLALSYALPNDKSEGVMVRAGYRKVGAMHRWSRVVRYDALVERRFGAGPVSRGAAAMATIVDRLARREFPWSAVAGMRAEAATFDTRFDELWAAASGQFALVGERTSGYLDWRFAQHPTRAYQLLTIAAGGGSLRGYMVYYLDGSTLRVADALAIDTAAWQDLIKAVVAHARVVGASVVTLLHFGSSAVQRLFEASGFHKRSADTSVLVCPATRQHALLPEDSWHLTEADRDV